MKVRNNSMALNQYDKMFKKTFKGYTSADFMVLDKYVSARLSEFKEAGNEEGVIQYTQTKEALGRAIAKARMREEREKLLCNE